MDPDPFVRWALDDARTLEERYTALVVIEEAEQRWNGKHRTGRYPNWEVKRRRERERFLNPAFQPEYTETSVRHAAEIMASVTEWRLQYWSDHERPVRDMTVLRFMPALEVLTVSSEIPDLALLAELPNLRELTFCSPVCEDFRPLARCAQLRKLSFTFYTPWPELEGLERLQQLESLSLNGNLLAFPGGLVFPRVQDGALKCAPLQARNVRDLPQFPACEFLELSGVERLDGIDAMPRLRNLKLTGPVRDFSPLSALPVLTCLDYSAALPLDVAPLNRVPALLYAAFTTSHTFGVDKAPARDYAPLAASPTLREISVKGCAPVELEVAALNAAFPTWDDLFLLPEPRPVPPLRVIIAPHAKHPIRSAPHFMPGEQVPADPGIRGCEERWLGRFATRLVSERIGHEDWGHVWAQATNRYLFACVECYEVLPRLGEILDAVREVLARLRAEYIGDLSIQLKVPPPKPTPAQAQLIEQFRDAQDEADFAQHQKDLQDLLERRHLLQIKQQQGEPIDPKDFPVEPPAPQPVSPWERSEEDDDDDDDDAEAADEDQDEEGSGNFVVKKKPEPLPDFDDDAHPLADNYRCGFAFTIREAWIDPRHAPIALHLLARDADEEIAEEPPTPPPA